MRTRANSRSRRGSICLASRSKLAGRQRRDGRWLNWLGFLSLRTGASASRGSRATAVFGAAWGPAAGGLWPVAAAAGPAELIDDGASGAGAARGGFAGRALAGGLRGRL